ncbi:50S ribosomal protein L11 methyltransferase [Mucilaginibacter limnophilus]|uniref:Ribosomal protein L11 methyltransferase n=1 Tax=Mucilaginibacter limnophilus TaxID=1932778 RepID=A0A3S2Y2P9_9SPHI|nr:50S ribosomal protein L11 methyltransferase [Mucilaginibacter limnophilus]RVU00554.1 50S ribosomal protein L11 methyltransferase [Mucilaginibacter limnophilus]
MDYYELHFRLPDAEDYQQDLLIDELAAIGFDTFEEKADGFTAYIPVNQFNKVLLDEQLLPYADMFAFNYDVNIIPQKNWNQEWESNFEPIQISNQIYVRATFHPSRPGFPYEIIIDPKMAFGTGHHQTTSMMLELMLENDFEGKSVLDMGCGTGILAIMAAKLGAQKVTAIDYDEVCYDSTIENAALNRVANILPLCGSKEVIPDTLFDIILANINRNILIDQMERYAEVLKQGGEIYFSGFYAEPDLDIIKTEAAKYGLNYSNHKTKQDWVAAKFIKAN